MVSLCGGLAVKYKFGDLFLVNNRNGVPFHVGATPYIDTYLRILSRTIVANHGDILLYVPDPNNLYIIFLHPAHGLVCDGSYGNPEEDMKFTQKQIILLSES